jgi:hypothetical protein
MRRIKPNDAPARLSQPASILGIFGVVDRIETRINTRAGLLKVPVVKTFWLFIHEFPIYKGSVT